MRDRVTVWLAVLGVIAVVAGVVLAFTDVLRDHPEAKQQSAPVRTHRFSSAQGGFTVRVPSGMTTKREGRSARFTTRDKTVVVSVGPAAGASPRAAATTLVQQLRSSYDEVRVLGRRHDRVDGRRGLTTYGSLRNGSGARLRFVLLVAPSGRGPFAITAFTRADSDPSRVLPLVDQVAGSFHAVGKGSLTKGR